jgi:hypothetical protein
VLVKNRRGRLMSLERGLKGGGDDRS